jgi:hypothetical protein
MTTIADFVANLQINLSIPELSSNLTPDDVTYINKLIQAESNISGNFGIISQVKMEFNSIINKNTISLHDIPQLILNICNILKTNIMENTIQNVSVLNIIKFILDSLFDSYLLPLNDTGISTMNTLIDSSLQLLETNIDFVVEKEEKQEVGCCSLDCFAMFRENYCDILF